MAYFSDAEVQRIKDLNDCGLKGHKGALFGVTMTTSSGRTGIELRKCSICLLDLLDTPAVRQLGRTVNVRSLR